MSRSKKFLLNSMSTAIMQVVTMIVGFITPRVMLTVYGSEINGLVSSITQFISYFNLVEAGLSGAAVYVLYKPLADNDFKGISSIVSAAKRFYNQAGYIFVSMTLGLSLIYPAYIQTNLLSSIEVGVLVLILGVNGALEFFTLAKYRAILTADQKTYVVSIASSVSIIANTLIIVVFAYLGANIIVLRFLALLAIFLRSIILMTYCKKKYSYLNYKEEPNTKALDKRWNALYLQILGTVQVGAPVILITLMLKDLKMVSVYTIFNMVLAGINGILSIFISGLSASFGDVIARKELKILQKSYLEFEFLYYGLITFVYSVTFITIMPFINIYTQNITDANYNLPIIGFLFVLNGLLYNIKTPQGMLVISAGMYRETQWQSTIQASILILGSVVLAPFLGMAGILIGSILSNLYRDIDLLFFIPKHLTKIPVKTSAFRILRILMGVVLSMSPFFFINFTPENLFGWFFYAIFVSAYVLVVVILINWIFDRKEAANVKRRIWSLVKK